MDILVLHPGALGDIILSLPALQIIREWLPAPRLILAANTDFAGTVGHGCADAVIPISTLPLHRLFGSFPLTDEDVAFWSAFEKIASWTGAADASFVERLMKVNPNSIISDWKPAPGDRRHVSRIFIDSIQPWLSGSPSTPIPRIIPRTEDGDLADEWTRKRKIPAGIPMIALHPGSGAKAKRWQASNFKVLARQLIADASAHILLVEGPAERGLSGEISRELPLHRTSCAKSLPLSTLAAIISRCHAYVGNDSGISHLAAAVGTPSLILFGPTDPAHWSPLGERVRVLRRAGGCVSCGGIRHGAHSCMQKITAGEVYDELTALMARSSSAPAILLP